jgi:3-deoxy-D-manno-octulosonic-acid transferase
LLILDFAYLLVFVLSPPRWLLLLALKPAFRAGLRDRFRLAGSGRPAGRTVWLHGASAGEIDLLRPLVGLIEARFSDSSIVISAFAVSGYTYARKTFPEHRVIYFPVDLAFVIRRFFRALQPVLIVIVESEMWREFFRGCTAATNPPVRAQRKDFGEVISLPQENRPDCLGVAQGISVRGSGRRPRDKVA